MARGERIPFRVVAMRPPHVSVLINEEAIERHVIEYREFSHVGLFLPNAPILTFRAIALLHANRVRARAACSWWHRRVDSNGEFVGNPLWTHGLQDQGGETSDSAAAARQS